MNKEIISVLFAVLSITFCVWIIWNDRHELRIILKDKKVPIKRALKTAIASVLGALTLIVLGGGLIVLAAVVMEGVGV